MKLINQNKSQTIILNAQYIISNKHYRLPIEQRHSADTKYFTNIQLKIHSWYLLLHKIKSVLCLSVSMS